MDNYVNKGKISTIEDEEHETVIPSFSDTPVTIKLIIPFFLKRCLETDMEVVYAQFPDNTGVILARLDGEWNHDLDDDLRVRGVTTVEDVRTDAVSSYNGHTHSCPDGETSAPHG